MKNKEKNILPSIKWQYILTQGGDLSYSTTCIKSNTSISFLCNPFKDDFTYNGIANISRVIFSSAHAWPKPKYIGSFKPFGGWSSDKSSPCGYVIRFNSLVKKQSSVP